MKQQGRQDSNLQPPVLETGALPVELLSSIEAAPLHGYASRSAARRLASFRPYFDSLWDVCLRQKRQNLLNSSRSVVFFLFFVVL